MKKIFGTCDSKCKHELTGQKIDNMDLSEILTPGTYMLGRNITDNENTGADKPTANGNYLIVTGLDEGSSFKQILICGIYGYVRNIFANDGIFGSCEDWKYFDLAGSNFILKNDNLSFLGGTITTEVEAGETGGYGYEELDYPTGFTAYNTWVISAMSSPTTGGDGIYEWGHADAHMDLYNQVNPKVILTADKIRVSVRHAFAASMSVNYKVVIFKVDNVG